MNKIKTAKAVDTGNNIWIFTGELEDGNYFLTSDLGITMILDEYPDLAGEDPEALTHEWQEKHEIKCSEWTNKTMYCVDRIIFCEDLINYLKDHPESRGGMTTEWIETYSEYFKKLYEG